MRTSNHATPTGPTNVSIRIPYDGNEYRADVPIGSQEDEVVRVLDDIGFPLREESRHKIASALVDQGLKPRVHPIDVMVNTGMNGVERETLLKIDICFCHQKLPDHVRSLLANNTKSNSWEQCSE